jgi:hypothetical protein
MFIVKAIFSVNTYIGILIGGVGAIAYFKWTKSQLNFKKPKK